MRENRPYGSEGGESGSTGLPYPYLWGQPNSRTIETIVRRVNSLTIETIVRRVNSRTIETIVRRGDACPQGWAGHAAVWLFPYALRLTPYALRLTPLFTGQYPRQDSNLRPQL